MVVVKLGLGRSVGLLFADRDLGPILASGLETILIESVSIFSSGRTLDRRAARAPMKQGWACLGSHLYRSSILPVANNLLPRCALNLDV